ncbi:uncharacterized protein [Coffea arabica]|uniref:DUF4220 domain-containing protein n=1 Tax=Coffea arabica TaxID=13443 RepID=A0A6P6WQW6_COFAR|nr:uncharacterized protein LOC113735095 [Coffea arabica]XP_027117821.1 uncharacterized protein LOC113735095 [Coffea arabica]
MASLIPDRVKRLWDDWNLRAAVLISLFFQMVLISLATSRKRTGNRIVNAIIWSFYLLADWLAAFAVGLISNGQTNGNPDKFRVNEDLAAFWAPFLLLHLGGPDNITAFSLEDNELWIRHLLGLVIQLVAVAYVFAQSIDNVLSVPIILLFLAGAIKYAERTRALYLGCLGNFKASMLPMPDAGPNYVQLMEEYSSRKAADVPVRIKIENEPERGSQTSGIPDWTTEEEITHLEVVQKGYEFFTTFRGLIVDHMFSFHERNQSRSFFSRRSTDDAFRVMEVELNFMYDSLYTKMAVVHGYIGFVFRFICSVLIVLSFVEFESHRSPEINHFDVTVTYILLCGAVGLDLVALIKVIFSDWTVVVLKNGRVKRIVSAVRDKLSSVRRWSNTISQHNLINFCLNQRWRWLDIAAETVGLKAFLDEMKYKKDFVIQDNLKEFIFRELKGKASKAETNKVAKEIYSARGQRALSDYIRCRSENMSSSEEVDYETMSLSVSEKVDYDESLLLWHIATELCYSTSPVDKNPNREFCKLISDYMLYLLVMRPTMMSAVAGIGQIRFQDTCEEAKKFFSRWKTESRPSISTALDICSKLNICRIAKNTSPARESSSATTRQGDACEKLLHVNTEVKPIDVKGDRSKSVLFDACRLAKELGKLKDDKKRWEIMSKVWVELLSYAASHCRPNAHAQELSKGGELITFVWILMAHFGLGEQFRIEAGHARAKLIVESRDYNQVKAK